jgi:hypothetical protein
MAVISFAAASQRKRLTCLRLVSGYEAWLPVQIRQHTLGRHDWDRGFDNIAADWTEPGCLRQHGGAFSLYRSGRKMLSITTAEMERALKIGLCRQSDDHELIIAADDLRTALSSFHIAAILAFRRRDR